MADEKTKETTVMRDTGDRIGLGEKIDGRIVIAQPLPSIVVQPIGSSAPMNQPSAETPSSGGENSGTGSNSDRK
jgi:hypothetical protein